MYSPDVDTGLGSIKSKIHMPETELQEGILPVDNRNQEKTWSENESDPHIRVKSETVDSEDSSSEETRQWAVGESGILKEVKVEPTVWRPDTCDTSTCSENCDQQLHNKSSDEVEEQCVNVKPNGKNATAKPVRFCIFCHTVIGGGKLKRHVFRVHKSEGAVKAAMSKTRTHQVEFIDEIRREGILWYNANILRNSSKQADIPTGELLSERKIKNPDNIRFCSDCKRFISGRNFWRHRKTCSGDKSVPVNPVTMLCESRQDNEFVSNILDKFRYSEAGRLCVSDKVIQQVGYRHYCLRLRHDSMQDDIKKSVMQEMRQLARLLIQFRATATEHGLDGANLGVEAMFSQQHLGVLYEAIDTLTEGGKCGLQMNLRALITRTMKSLKGMYAALMEDAKCLELDRFADAYRFQSHEMYAAARYQAGAESNDTARRPPTLLDEEALTMLKEYVTKEIKRLTSERKLQNIKYILLRSLVVCRLMLFNGSRCEEPSRMMITEWHNAKNGEWLCKNQAGRYLVGQCKVAYLHGKGRKFVPVLIPVDCVQAIELLITQRSENGIVADNHFVFASRGSKTHCSGWPAVRQTCDQAGMSLSVTTNQHHTSTLPAEVSVSSSNRDSFVQEIGHGDNCQSPAGRPENRVKEQMHGNLDAGTSEPASTSGLGMCRKRTIAAVDASCDNEEEVVDASSDNEEEVVDTSSDNEEEVVPRPKNRAVDISSDNEEEVVDTSSDNEDGVVPQPKKRAKTIHWNEVDNAMLEDYFEPFFDGQGTENGTKGSLPSKTEILSFISTAMPPCLQHLDDHTAYLKTRAQLFNRRKTRQRLLNKCLLAMSR